MINVIRFHDLNVYLIFMGDGIKQGSRKAACSVTFLIYCDCIHAWLRSHRRTPACLQRRWLGKPNSEEVMCLLPQKSKQTAWVHPKWHTYSLHSSLLLPIGLWSKWVYYIGIRVPFGMQTLPSSGCFRSSQPISWRRKAAWGALSRGMLWGRDPDKRRNHTRDL